MRPTPLPLTPAMRLRPRHVPSETARQIEAVLPDMRRTARQLCETWSKADDLVQDVLMTLWAQADALDARPEVLRRQVFDTLRARAAALPGTDASHVA